MLITRLSKNLAQANDQIASTSHTLIEARAEIEKLEEDLRWAHGERARIIESLSRLTAVLVGFQSMIQDEAVVGSRGWAYLHALNDVTRLLIKKYLPELTGQVRPLDKRALRAALIELGKYGQNQVYKSLLETLQHEEFDE
jgi:hypothetical protein